jgi:nucleolar complex protein 2
LPVLVVPARDASVGLVGKELGPCNLGICNFFESGSKSFGCTFALLTPRPDHAERPAYTLKMAMSKATKKFEKNKLGDVLKQRKNVAKIKQKKQMDLKKKERKAKDNAKADDVEDPKSKKPSSRAEKEDASLGEMSMDQFFEGGFQVPEMTGKASTKPKTGKRKRTPIENGDAADSDAEMAEANGGAEDSASDSDSGDDAEAHMGQLKDLEEKDPEFYKYLKNNDAELLDFAEDADLAEIDALSASEDETTPRKKKKAAKEPESEDEEEATTGNEVTKKLIKKWKESMEAKSSLRAMREVVLAFRTAAHLNDEEGQKYKYTISDPDGKRISIESIANDANNLQRTMRFS